ncbi:hypothetical protein EOA85_22610 [Mesorhizobium sp. M5C.F.Ca.IN.020.29.1.1]|uniref:hypothetical protein n=1 Tax=unclassified Mesorhizobium TaxID=325217 RepID=UPI000FCAB74E|nr:MULTISPECIES: hypothetical protein [unclassified Mesorhizobium]RUV55089.1 hypothetical protein EOA85_22610 [Mesorhizobium sp. M5C.F.Ca.IN.020.29.1.1]TIM83560.1 MAG: hypothetical protein E5Y50_25115 [Mesorhizobium sp.]
MARSPKDDTNMSSWSVLQPPHSWLFAADNLHAQATALARAKGKGLIVQIDANDKVLGHWDEANKAVFLLGGSPLENAIKAFLIYENPTSWISNGGLIRRSSSKVGRG